MVQQMTYHQAIKRKRRDKMMGDLIVCFALALYVPMSMVFLFSGRED